MTVLSIVHINEYDSLIFDEASLSNDRRLKISRIKHEKSRRLSICAEIALQRAVREFTGEEVRLPLDIEEEKGGRGKLFFSEKSPYHGKLFFSLSHAGDLAAAAVSDHDIGMDIETTDRKLPKSVDKIFSPSLYERFKRLERPEQDDFFFESWTGIESYMKLSGQGIYLDTKKTEISPDGQISSSESDIRGFISSCTALLETNGISGYKCSICSRQESESVTLLFLFSPFLSVSGS